MGPFPLVVLIHETYITHVKRVHLKYTKLFWKILGNTQGARLSFFPQKSLVLQGHAFCFMVIRPVTFMSHHGDFVSKLFFRSDLK